MEPSNKNQGSSAKDIHHLFSVLLTTSILAFLYLPRPLTSLLISPSFLSSLLLIFSVFRFGSPVPQPSPQPSINDSIPPPEHTQERNFTPTINDLNPSPESTQEKDYTPAATCWSLIEDHHSFDFARPLDIIYEEYEGEETESEDSSNEKESESSKEGDELERWLEYARWLSENKDKEQQIEEDELIELAFGEDEDNLIELDLSRYQIEDIKQEKVVGY